MKKIFSALMISLFVMTAIVPQNAYAADVVYEENVIDKMSDWAATIGKDGLEKDKILATRKAERQAKHTAKQAEKLQKEAAKKGKEMKKEAGKKADEMKKKMGM